jgi:hypothetical protein
MKTTFTYFLTHSLNPYNCNRISLPPTHLFSLITHLIASCICIHQRPPRRPSYYVKAIFSFKPSAQAFTLTSRPSPFQKHRPEKRLSLVIDRTLHRPGHTTQQSVILQLPTPVVFSRGKITEFLLLYLTSSHFLISRQSINPCSRRNTTGQGTAK